MRPALITGPYPLFASRRREPPTVTLDSVATGQDGGVLVTWTLDDDGGLPVTEFDIYRGPSAGSETLIATVGPDETSYLDHPGPGVWYYAVSAVNAAGEGPASDSLIAGTRGVCIAFTDPTLEPNPTWTPLTDYGPDGLRVQRWVIRRGRQDELNTMSKGTVTITVHDHGGVLDATNPASPLTGVINALPQLAIFVTNPLNGVEQTRFRGFVASIQTRYDVSQKYFIHTINAVDLFDILEAAEVIPDPDGNTTYAEGQVDDRINALLADAQIPVELQRVHTGNVWVQQTVYAPRSSILEAIQEAADAEFPGIANFYIDKDGVATFHGRYARFHPFEADYFISKWKAGDGAACSVDNETAPLTDMAFTALDTTYIINAALAYPFGIDRDLIPNQLATDNTSIDDIGTRSTGFENLRTLHGLEVSQLDANEETLQFAEYYVNNYSTPKTRIQSLHFSNRTTGSPNPGRWWRLVTRIDLNDMVTVTTTNLGGGGFAADYFVEGITETGTPDLAAGDRPYIDMVVNVSPRAYYENTYPDGP